MDPMRLLDSIRSPGMVAMLLSNNRNKRSVVIDLKRLAAGVALDRMIVTANVFVHNVRPQTTARLNIDRASVRTTKPGIVYAMAFALLTYRESLRDVEACLRAETARLYYMCIRSRISCSTLANANEVHDWRIYADLAESLTGIARRLYAGEPFGVDLISFPPLSQSH